MIHMKRYKSKFCTAYSHLLHIGHFGPPRTSPVIHLQLINKVSCGQVPSSLFALQSFFSSDLVFVGLSKRCFEVFELLVTDCKLTICGDSHPLALPYLSVLPQILRQWNSQRLAPQTSSLIYSTCSITTRFNGFLIFWIVPWPNFGYWFLDIPVHQMPFNV